MKKKGLSTFSRVKQYPGNNASFGLIWECCGQTGGRKERWPAVQFDACISTRVCMLGYFDPKRDAVVNQFLLQPIIPTQSSSPSSYQAGNEVFRESSKLKIFLL